MFLSPKRWIEVQPIENPIVELKVLCAPDEIPNKVIAQYFDNYGKVETERTKWKREMTEKMTNELGYPLIETRRSRIGQFPVEVRY